MYKNQLQELAQRSCFNLPSYVCMREGPDHAPRFKASVNFNGEIFEAPSYCTTLRQAEHAAAEVALDNLSTRGPSSLAARVLDETGVYKNLLQETAHRAGLKLPVYTTVRSGPGHSPVFTSVVELAGVNFAGEPAKNKKQAEKNAAMAAWSALRQMPNLDTISQHPKESESSDDQERAVVARVLSSLWPKEESRPTRPRDQQHQLQHKKRVLLGFREGSTGSPYNPLRYRQQKQSSLLALPPPTGRRILPPSSPFFQHYSPSPQELSPSNDNNNNDSSSLMSLIPSSKPIEVHIRNTSQVSMQEIPPPVEEQEKYEKELITERSDDKGNSFIDKPAVAFHQRRNHLQSSLGLSSRSFSPPPHHNSLNATVPMRIPIPRIISSGGFYGSGIAPAVHIRSVIPVCAAPPARPLENTRATDKREQDEEGSETASKLGKLRL